MSSEKRVLTDDQRELLTTVLDRIVPASDGLLGVVELGVGSFVEGDVAASPKKTRLFVGGLTQVQVTSRHDRSAAFQDLDGDAKDAVLRSVESAEPEFFDELVRLTYVGYYSNPKVVARLGLEARPPHPLGYELEQGDLSLLDNVTRRGPIYREA